MPGGGTIIVPGDGARSRLLRRAYVGSDATPVDAAPIGFAADSRAIIAVDGTMASLDANAASRLAIGADDDTWYRSSCKIIVPTAGSGR